MKVADIRDTVTERAGELVGGAQKATKDLMKGAEKAAYAAVGAPVVVGRQIAEYGAKVGSSLRQEIDAYVEEGETLAAKLREGDLVDEVKDRVDIDQLQDRVERLRDQLEDVLANWRESFRPDDAAAPAEEVKEAPKKAAPKKAAAKPAASAKKPAAKKTTTKTTK